MKRGTLILVKREKEIYTARTSQQKQFLFFLCKKIDKLFPIIQNNVEKEW